MRIIYSPVLLPDHRSTGTKRPTFIAVNGSGSTTKMPHIRPAPLWPGIISSQADLVTYIRADRRLLYGFSYGRDFFPPYYGETAYHDISGQQFSAMMFGTVVGPVVSTLRLAAACTDYYR
jgi:hypothetical protein